MLRGQRNPGRRRHIVANHAEMKELARSAGHLQDPYESMNPRMDVQTIISDPSDPGIVTQ